MAETATLPGAFLDQIGELIGKTAEQVIALDVSQHIPLGRWGEPEEVAAAVAFLTSERASYITGTNLIVDGGRCKSWA